MLKKWNKKYWAGMGVILALTGCTSVADMVGYDTASLNEDAAKSYSQVIQKARGQKALDVSSPLLNAFNACLHVCVLMLSVPTKPAYLSTGR